MGRIDVSAHKDHTAFRHLLLYFVQEAVIEAKLEIYTLRALSAVREINVIEDEISEVQFNGPSLVIKFICPQSV